MRDAKARAAFATAMAAAGVVGLVGMLLAVGGAYAFSRDQERDADRISVVLLRSNGYDTREAPKVWANLLDELKANPDNNPSLDSVLFATHPSSDDRRAELQRLAAQTGGRTAAAEYRAIAGATALRAAGRRDQARTSGRKQGPAGPAAGQRARQAPNCCTSAAKRCVTATPLATRRSRWPTSTRPCAPARHRLRPIARWARCTSP